MDPNKLGRVKKFDYTIRFRPQTSDENVIGHSFENDIYLPVLKYIDFKKGDVVFDVGSHIGTFSLMLHQITQRQLEIHCFEASIDTYNILKLNVESNGLSNIKPHHVALTGDDVGTQKLFYDTEHGNWGHSVVHNFGGEFEEVKNVTFKDFIDFNNISNIKLIKFNCEGSEVGIVMKTPQELLKKIDNIVLLYHFDLVEDYSLNDLKSKLRESGLTFYDLKTELDRGWLVGTRNPTLKFNLSRLITVTYNRLGVLKRKIESLIK
ncbi:MAG: FkbM family methyltransferase [Bacteroidia bacterium]|nr:FkbM family methyltransferase [Bacteroidia bacterium]NNJ55859.1 FkbM family methyltransferase [Bacteroidia bacterium]